MIKAITMSIKNEKPVFVKFVYENIISIIENGMIQPVEIIDNIMESIVNIFMNRKRFLIDFKNEKVIIDYNFCKLSLISSEPEKEKNKLKIIKNTEIDKASGFHNHIVYLYSPEDVKK